MVVLFSVETGEAEDVTGEPSPTITRVAIKSLVSFPVPPPLVAPKLREYGRANWLETRGNLRVETYTAGRCDHADAAGIAGVA